MSKRFVEPVQQRVKERMTSLPAFDQPREENPRDPRKAPGGAPLAPLQEYGRRSREAFAAVRPTIFTGVSSDQIREDATEHWSGEDLYVSRLGTLMKRPGDLFTGLHFTGDDIFARRERLAELSLCASEREQEAAHLRATYHVESADLLRMCDVGSMVLESKMALPTLTQAQRAQAQDVAELALESWRDRQDRQQASARERDRKAEDYEARLAELERRAVAAEAEAARLRVTLGTPMPMPTASLPVASPAQPARRSRKR